MKTAKSEELDHMFEEGCDLSGYMDASRAERLNRPALKRVNVDFPEWMVEGLDVAAARLAVNRQAVIKTWIADRLKDEHIA